MNVHTLYMKTYVLLHILYIVCVTHCTFVHVHMYVHINNVHVHVQCMYMYTSFVVVELVMWTSLLVSVGR